MLLHAAFIKPDSVLKIRVVTTQLTDPQNEAHNVSITAKPPIALPSFHATGGTRDISMVAKSIGASIDLETECSSIVFTFKLKVAVSESIDNTALPSQVRLICADDDPMARRVCSKVTLAYHLSQLLVHSCLYYSGAAKIAQYCRNELHDTWRELRRVPRISRHSSIGSSDVW